MLKLVVATGNKGKLAEIRKLLKNQRIELDNLKNFDVAEVPETGLSFRENSDLKASEYALQTRQWTLADDSGLEVPALANEPGVRSARFAGAGSTDSENIRKLLDVMAQISDKQRLARFVCSISVSNPLGEIILNSDGECSGRISAAPRGENGFGYDPVFIPDGFAKTFGELSEGVKQRLSHRAIALEKIVELLSGIPDF